MFNASVILHYVVNRASDNVFHIKKLTIEKNLWSETSNKTGLQLNNRVNVIVEIC